MSFALSTHFETGIYASRACLAGISIIITGVILCCGCCYRTACRGKVYLIFYLAITHFLIGLLWLVTSGIGVTYAETPKITSTFESTLLAVFLTTLITSLKQIHYLLILIICINSALKVREIYKNSGNELAEGDKRKKYRQNKIRVFLLITLIFPILYGFVWMVLSFASLIDFNSTAAYPAYIIYPGVFGQLINITAEPFIINWMRLWITLQPMGQVYVSLMGVAILVINTVTYLSIAIHIRNKRRMYQLQIRDYLIACGKAFAKVAFLFLDVATLSAPTVIYIVGVQLGYLSKVDQTPEGMTIAYFSCMLLLAIVQGLQGLADMLLYGWCNAGFSGAIKSVHRTPIYMQDRVMSTEDAKREANEVARLMYSERDIAKSYQ